jgi:formylglycine-generating enzyme required for sulfatase activity/serine/threonine protein kinase
MGAVYLARDTQLDRLVALKVPRLGGEDQPAPGDLERFFREARAAAALLHPNLCPIFDVGDVDGTPYLTMAYLEGRLLSGVIERGKPLSQRQTALIVRKLATALQEAHARGVIHRDLKPSNVMISARGEPIVMDFGLAWRDETVEARLTKDGTVLGTPAYMSPEQVRGETRAIGPACDIYALGVILYELLAGRLPFEGSVLNILGKILTEEPKPPSRFRSDLDPRLEAICLKAMAKQAEDRYASMAELAAALAAQLRAMRETPRPAPDMGPAAEPGPRAGGDPMATVAARTLFAPSQAEPSPLTTSPTPRPSWRNPDGAHRSLAPLLSGRLLTLAAAGAVALLVLGYAAFEGTGYGWIKPNRDGSSAGSAGADEPPPTQPEPRPGPVVSSKAAGLEPEPKKREVPSPPVSDKTAQALPAPPAASDFVKKASQPEGEKSPDPVSTASGAREPPKPAETKKVRPPAPVEPILADVARSGPGPVKTPPLAAPPAGTGSALTATEPKKGTPRPVSPPELLTTRVGRITLKRLPAGASWMGSPEGEGFPNEHPRRQVWISRAFYLGIHEVTQAQYRAVVAENPSHFSGAGPGRDKVASRSTDEHPVDSVSWFDAVRFCNILSEREDLEPFYEIDGETVHVPDWNGTGYRLPSEAEWEYACRAGSTTRYGFGNAETELGNYAWYERRAGGQTHPVGRKRPNAWGLHDLHGNVWEWCWDWYDEHAYQRASDRDPTGPPKGTHRVLRGGSFHDVAVVLRSATRGRDLPTNRERVNGLRIARTFR